MSEPNETKLNLVVPGADEKALTPTTDKQSSLPRVVNWVLEILSKLSLIAATSERIRTSKKLEVEEEYETESSKALGFQKETGGVNVGVKTSNRKVTKRIIKLSD